MTDHVLHASMSSMYGEDEKTQDVTTDVERGPYILHKLLSKEQLLEDGLRKDAYVTCVEFWNDNLYVGTSAAEVIHYVRIAPLDDAVDEQAGFTYAFKLEVPFAENADSVTQVPGIQQILLLPRSGKACILCNGSISFYSLPELAPAFSSSTRPHNCTWVGGLDLNEDDSSDRDSVTIMICQKSRVRLVAVGERAQKVRDIELGGCLGAVRRSDIACVADANSYSLLDVIEQQRIPLFEISSISELETSDTAELSEASLSISTAANSRTENQSNDAVKSFRNSPELGSITGTGSRHSEQTSSSNQNRGDSEDLGPNASNFRDPGSASTLNRSPPKNIGQDNPAEEEPGELDVGPPRDANNLEQSIRITPTVATKLRPNIISMNPNEFMLTTGTSYNDQGVGMFVNLDGEATRGTIKFSRYPEAICSDGKEVDLTQSDASEDMIEEPFVLALIDNAQNQKNAKAIEIKRWDIDPAEPSSKTYLLNIPCERRPEPVEDFGRGVAGLREIASTCDIRVNEIIEILGLSQLHPPNLRSSEQTLSLRNTSTEFDNRTRAEAKFIGRLSDAKAHMLVWGHNSIFWIVRNPMIMKMDGFLREAVNLSPNNAARFIDRTLVERTLNDVRGREALSELEFHTLNYIRQKGSLMLFMDLMHQSLVNDVTQERDSRVTEEALSEGGIDPRVLLSIIPSLNVEVIQGPQGIWVPNGLNNIMQKLWERVDLSQDIDPLRPSGERILQLVKRYLFVWRGKKGLPSVLDEKEVFQTVDAALLRILLLLDSQKPPGPAKKGPIRSELNAVVDHSVDCFERAIVLLEEFKRLYVLSRLYQSRKMSRQVLATWRRIIEGEDDLGGEMVDGETEVRRYLAKINDANLVEEYGTWLASRNPKLGVRVFADSSGKIKFHPERAVEILKQGAPGAVKDLLEYLVFEHNLAHYVNDLIKYYLDSVVSELEQSSKARSILLHSYESYRALRPPKPTYSQFAADYAFDAEWWQNRLRLLQVLGGNQGPASTYDVSAMISRIEPYEKDLIPEMIILNGRQGRHRQALRLLTHGLGDFDTAIRYCVLGGSSTYTPLIGSLPKELIPSREEQELLFSQLVEEFLNIDDLNDRVMQTSQLLERFAAWVDIRQVLTLLPDSWSVEIVSRFLENAFRSIISERNETLITRALTNSDNLAVNFDLIEKSEWGKPQFEGFG